MNLFLNFLFNFSATDLVSLYENGKLTEEGKFTFEMIIAMAED
jgi:hypothetical protein